jgi:hypothetical protein
VTPSRAAERFFYERALSAADRAALSEARAVEGIADEVAMLRVLVRQALEQHPDDGRLIQEGFRLLIRALVAQHRISGREADGITDALGTFITRLAEAVSGAPDA